MTRGEKTVEYRLATDSSFPEPTETEKVRWLEIAKRVREAGDEITRLRGKYAMQNAIKKRRNTDIDTLTREMLHDHGLGIFQWPTPVGTFELVFDPAGKVEDGTWNGEHDERLGVRVTFLRY